MITPSKELLDRIFGASSRGDTVAARALSSPREYVRGLDGISAWVDGAAGRRLTAWEAFEAYGLEALLEVEESGVAVLWAGPDAAGRPLRERRTALGLEPRQVSGRAGLDLSTIERAERSDPSLSIRKYERIAQALGLDERQISVAAEPRGNEELAVRLRLLDETRPRMTRQAVSALAEAAWVAALQLRLQTALGIRGRAAEFLPSSDYGLGRPAFEPGYERAAEVRAALDLGAGPLPRSLRETCEDVLGIPLLQAELGEWIAGATVGIGLSRAIVLNLGGKNRHVAFRRSTLAHELGHVLFDPAQKLEGLRVDEFDELERTEGVRDPVEQRANAFAIELLAPRAAVRTAYLDAETAGKDALLAVMNSFGISRTAARYQVWNALRRVRPLESIHTPELRISSAWDAGEAYTVDYHPLQELPPIRAGRFSAVVLRAAEERLISWDSAAFYLLTDEATLRSAASAIRELFPTVFPLTSRA